MPNIEIPPHPLRLAAEVDLHTFIGEIENITGLRSRWEGYVWVRDGTFENHGQKASLVWHKPA